MLFIHLEPKPVTNQLAFVLRNKAYIPVFYRGNKIWVQVRVCMNEITIALVPITCYRDKTRVQMFYFDSNTIVPLHCAALGFWESVC